MITVKYKSPTDGWVDVEVLERKMWMPSDTPLLEAGSTPPKYMYRVVHNGDQIWVTDSNIDAPNLTMIPV